MPAPPPASEPDSVPLLARVASGEPGAVEACLDRFGGLIWSLARKQIPDRGQAEDLVQEIFVEIWRSAGRYRAEIASETAFVATIARRRLIDHGRRRQARPDPKPLEVVEEAPAHDGGLGRVEICDEAAVAGQALEALRPEQKQVLLLSIKDGLSHREIAEALDLPLGTVKSHVRRGLQRVAELLGADRSKNRTEEVRS